MSLLLSNVILHQLTKNDQEEWSVQLRKQPLENNSATECFIDELHSAYSAKGAKGFGRFGENSDFESWLKQQQSHQLDFLTLSDRIAHRFQQEIAQYSFAESGTLVLASYESLATHYLFIGLLPMHHSVTVTDTLEISQTDYLDVAKMDIAARIDVSLWLSDPDSNRYLTFVKGRVGRKIADLFLGFLQAEIGLDVKAQNKTLMRAVEDYCTDAQLDEDKSQACRQQVYDYCQTHLQLGEEVTIAELSKELPSTQEGGDFDSFTNQKGYELAEQFPADRATVRKLTKFVGAGGGLNVSFDSELLGERIIYDAETDTLTIKGTPPNLKDQLKRRLQHKES